LNDSLTLAAIEFASPAMLGWLGAAALPWLVNLWSRRRHVETPWAAVDLLLAAVRERSRRLRLRELLLLAVRTAILLLVALGAARPVWRAAAGADVTGERTHYVLVIDQSFSMAVRSEVGNRLAGAQQRAREIIDEAAAGDAFTVIGWAEVADNVLGRPTFDASAARKVVDSLEAVDTPADLSAALRAVDGALNAAEDEFPEVSRSRVVFISDLAGPTWVPALSKPVGTNGAERQVGKTSTLWADLSARCELSIESVDDGVRENVAITDVSIDPAAPTLDAPATVSVQVTAFGGSPRRLPVELLLDGDRLGRQEAEIQPGEPAVVHFETRLLEAGNHMLEARLAGDVDALAVDNRRWLSTEVRRRLQVACVADDRRSAADIARALNPRYRDGAAGGIAVEGVATASLATHDLAASDAVFLCNVAELLPREQRMLRRYVAEGGALVIVLGNRVRGAAYNEFLASDAANDQLEQGPLLPVQIAPQTVEGDWRIDPLEYRHPVLAPFAGRSRAGLLGIQVSKYYPLEMERSEKAPAVAMAFSSGDPAIVVGDYWLGRVAVITTDPALASGEEPWSTLAVSPSFVPLVRELFQHVAVNRRSERLNCLAGEPLVAPMHTVGQSSADGSWEDPAGETHTTAPSTRRRGVYTFRPAPTTGAGSSATAIAVNVDPRESDLSSVDLADLIGPKKGQASRLSAAQPYAGAVPLERFLLAAAAALVLLELGLAWLFGRGWA